MTHHERLKSIAIAKKHRVKCSKQAQQRRRVRKGQTEMSPTRKLLPTAFHAFNRFLRNQMPDQDKHQPDWHILKEITIAQRNQQRTTVCRTGNVRFASANNPIRRGNYRQNGYQADGSKKSTVLHLEVYQRRLWAKLNFQTKKKHPVCWCVVSWLPSPGS